MASALTTIEGTVEDGQIKLPEHTRLPERTKVYVVVPGGKEIPVARIASPRLAHPEQAADFAMEVKENADAGV